MSPRPISLDAFLQKSSKILGERLRTDKEALERASGDESGLDPVLPAAVATIKNEEELEKLVRAAVDHNVGLVPRGAGSGKAGACIPATDNVVVDMSGMSSIERLAPADMVAVVQPGVVNQHLDQAAMEHGFFYPPDPASYDWCTIGGNIATNAGGPRALKYGVTRRYVWGLRAVLGDGRIVSLGRQSMKGVTGLELAGLFVGAEGTLGFITQATMHIVPNPRCVQTAWVTFQSPEQASKGAQAIFARGFLPRILELLDARAIKAVVPHSAVPANDAGAALIIEADGNHEAAVAEELHTMCEVAGEQGGCEQLIATSEKQRRDILDTRRMVSPRLKEQFPYKLSDDIAVPRSAMPTLLKRAQGIAQDAGVTLCAYGHLGDGNLHINLLCNTLEQREQAQLLRPSLFKVAIELGGCISGEHGLGLAKRAHLGLQQSSQVIDLQRDVKRVFDPHGIMNPNKVWPPVAGDTP